MFCTACECRKVSKSSPVPDVPLKTRVDGRGPTKESDMNGSIEVALTGRLGTEPELKTSQAGKPWAAFNVGVGDGDNIQWVRIAVFGERAQELSAILRKGDRVYVEGAIRLNEWTGKDGEKHAGLSVAAWKCEKLVQIGRNKPPKAKN